MRMQSQLVRNLETYAYLPEKLNPIVIGSTATITMVAGTRVNLGLGYVANPLPLTLNVATVGPNGIDTGSISDDLWYVYLITTTSGDLALIASISDAGPSGYTSWKFVGAFIRVSSAINVIFQRYEDITWVRSFGNSTNHAINVHYEAAVFFPKGKWDLSAEFGLATFNTQGTYGIMTHYYKFGTTSQGTDIIYGQVTSPPLFNNTNSAATTGTMPSAIKTLTYSGTYYASAYVSSTPGVSINWFRVNSGSNVTGTLIKNGALLLS